MNLVILIDSAQVFFRNFGLRYVYAALDFAIRLAAPKCRSEKRLLPPGHAEFLWARGLLD
jgi:hypothetical protein